MNDADHPRHGPPTRYQAAAADYRDRYGWATFALGAIVWATPGHGIEALNMPRQLGRRTLANLHNGGTPAPVIEVPGETPRWVFLIQPWRVPAELVTQQFAGHDIGYAHPGPGARWGIDLPPTQHPGHDRLAWITAPGAPPPPPTQVAEAVIDVLRLR